MKINLVGMPRAFVKTLRQWIQANRYYLWTRKRDYSSCRLIDEWCEYSGENIAEVIRKCIYYAEKLAEEWHKAVKNTTSEELDKYYGKFSFLYHYLAEQLAVYEKHIRSFNADPMRFLIRSLPSEAEVMEFGGGGGELCLMLSNYFTNVTYVDIPGELYKFAQWRFRKHNANITCIPSSATYCEVPKEKYDCIISIATLEHVVNLQYWINTLCNSIKLKGFLYLTFDTGTSDPSHISAQEDYQRHLRENGMTQIGEYVYIKGIGREDAGLSLHSKIRHGLASPVRFFIGYIINPLMIIIQAYSFRLLNFLKGMRG